MLPMLLAIAMLATSVPVNTLAAETVVEDLDTAAGKADAAGALDTAENTGDVDADLNSEREEVLGAADIAAEINVKSLKDLGNAIINITVDDNDTIIAEWNDDKNVFSSVYDKLISDDSNETGNYYVSVTTINPENQEQTDEGAAFKSNLKFQWQDSNGNMALGATPSEPGEYKLEITLDSDIASAEPKYINFRIDKKKVEITSTKDTTGVQVKSGTEAKDVIETVKDSISFSPQLAANYFDEPVVVISETNGSSKVLGDTDKLLKGKDYSASVTVALKSDYTSKVDVSKISTIPVQVNNYKSAKVVIDNLAFGAGMPIIRKIGEDATPKKDGDNAEIKISVISKEEIDEATGKNKDITPALSDLVYTWIDPNGEILEKAPTEAGTYYYYVMYQDKEGIYLVDEDDAANSYITVVIEPTDLYLKTVSANATKKYYEGNKVSSILNNFYTELYYVENDKPYKGNDIYGVTYNQPDMPQRYQPVLRLQKAQYEEGDEVVWRDLDHNGDTVDVATGKDEETGLITRYRVIFSGKKGTYLDGVLQSEVNVNDTDANSSDINYKIDLSKIEQNAIEIEVLKAANAEIDVTKLLKDGKGISMNSIYKQIYDHEKPLYKNRSEYKKAFLTISENAVKNHNGTFTYTWYKFKPVQDKTDAEKLIFDEEGNPVYKQDENGWPILDPRYPIFIPEPTTYSGLPKDAAGVEYSGVKIEPGFYMLLVSYEDESGEYVAEDKAVFYEIDQQIIKVVPKSEPKIVEYEYTPVWAVSEDWKDALEYEFYKADGNKVPAEKLSDFTELTEALKSHTSSYLYDVDLIVEEGDDTDLSKANWKKANPYDALKLGVPYRVSAEVTLYDDYSDADGCTAILSKNFTNYYYAKSEETGEYEIKNYSDTVPVEVRKMGTTEIEIFVDPSKAPARKKVYDGTGIDLTDAIKNGYITVKEKLSGKEVNIDELNLRYYWEYTDPDDDDYCESRGIVSQPDASTHILSKIEFSGNDTYFMKTLDDIDEEFVIEPRELVVTLPVKKNEDIAAGRYEVSDVIDINAEGAITGYIEADAAAFGMGVISKARAFGDDVWAEIIDDYDDEPSVIKYDHEYEIEIWASSYDGEYDNTAEYWVYDREIATMNDIFHGYKLKDDHKKNYKLVYKNKTFKPLKHGRAEVKENKTTAYDGFTKLAAEYGDAYDTTVIPKEGIPFCYDVVDKERNKIGDGNLFTFNIHIPYEYEGSYLSRKNLAAYKNSVEACGGFVMTEDDGYDVDDDDPVYMANADFIDPDEFITVAFPVNKTTAKYDFQIEWEAGFVEKFTVDLSKVQLEANLKEAVAPKSLKFNVSNRKMAVGETMPLDVVMTKVQHTDIVKLNYEVTAGNEYLSVTKDSGIATALKAGANGKPSKATVSVYPVRLNDEGKLEKIPGAKPATVVISVSDVTAPKKFSLYAFDDSVEYKYFVPSDGYRREVYLMEGKVTNAQAEENIKNMGTGEFDVFMEYVNDTDPDDGYDKDKNIYTGEIIHLKPSTEYTLYIRNVSGIRTLDDKSPVSESNASVIKTFKTHKPQILDYRDDSDTSNIIVDMSSDDYAAKKIKELRDADGNVYSRLIELSSKSVQVAPKGIYAVTADGADANDIFERYIPFAGVKSCCVAPNEDNCNPSLSYYAVETTLVSDDDGNIKIVPDRSDKKEGKFTLKIGDYYYKKSTIATVNKKGVVSLKGVGDLCIVAYDSISKKTGHGFFVVRDTVTSIKPKAVTLKVGDVADLYDYIDFMNATNKKITGKNGLRTQYPLDVVPENPDAVKVRDYDNGVIYAAEPGKVVNVKVSLKDRPDIYTTVRVTTKAMDKVKALKAVDTVDNASDFTFTYKTVATDKKYPVDTFRVELRDSRKALISSEIRKLNSSCVIGPKWIWNGTDDDSDTINGCLNDGEIALVEAGTNSSKGVYAYRLRVDEKITRLSNYTVSIVPVFTDYNTGLTTEYEAAAATKKFKTTNVPISHVNMGKKLADFDAINVQINVGYDGEDNVDIEDAGYLKSGNSYTLTLNPSDSKTNSFAYYNGTDKVSWSVADKSIASVKATNGGMGANLKILKPGKTKVVVKSGITKKVVARYTIWTKNVGDGSDSYGSVKPYENEDQFNDYEDQFNDYEDHVYDWDPTYDQGIEILTEANPARFKTNNSNNDYRWIAFTAPCEATYDFDVTNGSISLAKYADGSRCYDYDPAVLDEGQKIYLKVSGNTGNSEVVVKVTSSGKVGRLSLERPVETENVSVAKFEVPEDGFYMFYGDKARKQVYITYNNRSDSRYVKLYNADNTAEYNDDAVIALRKGDVVELNISNLDGVNEIGVKKAESKVLSSGTESSGKLKDGETKWIKIKANKTGEYNIKSVSFNGIGQITARVYTSLIGYTDYTLNADGGLDLQLFLEAGDELWIKLIGVPTVDEDEAATVSVDVAVTEPKDNEMITEGSEKAITIAKGKDAWVGFVLPEKDKEYTFTALRQDGKEYKVNQKFYYDGSEITPDSSITVPGTNSYYTGYRVYTKKLGDSSTYNYDEMTAGKVVLVKLSTTDTAEDAATVKVKFTETKVTEVKEGVAAELTLQNSAMSFYKFNVQKDETYAVEMKVTKNADPAQTHEAKNVASIYVYNDAINHETNAGSPADAYTEAGVTDKYTFNGFVKFVNLDAGEQIFALRPDDDFSKVDSDLTTSKATLTIKKVEPKTLTVGKEETIAKYSSQVFEYIPTATGYYTIKASGDVDSLGVSVGSEALRVTTGDVYRLTSGKKVTITVKNSGDADKKIKIDIAEATKKLPEAKFTVSANSAEVRYTYTPKNLGRYKFTVKATDPAVTVTVNKYDSFTGDATTISDGDEIVLRNGYTGYYEIKAEKDDEAVSAEVQVSIEEIKPAALDVTGKEFTVTKGTRTWYKYTVPKTGRYFVKVGQKEGSTTEVKLLNDYALWKNANYTGDYLYNNKTKSISFLDSRWLKAGDEFIVAVYNSSSEADDSISVTIKELDATVLTLGKASTATTIKAGDTAFYRINDLKHGTYYDFTVEPKDEYRTSYTDAKSLNIKYIINDSNAWEEPDTYPVDGVATAAMEYRSLSKGDGFALIKIENTGDTDIAGVTIKVSETPMKVLTTGTNKVAVKNGKTVYGKFEPVVSDYFGVYVKPIANVEISSIYIDGDEVNPFGIIDGKIGETYLFSAYVETAEGKAEDQEIEVEIERIKPEALSKGDKTVKAKVGKRYLYTFTAPEDGRYSFAADSETAYVDINKYDEDWDNASSATKYIALEKGEKAYLGVSYDTMKEDGATIASEADIKITVSQETPIALAYGENVKTVKQGERKWLIYTATKDGVYNIKFSSKVGEGEYSSKSVYRRKNITSTTSMGYSSSFTGLNLKEGDKLYFEAQNTYGDSDIDLKVEVEGIWPEELKLGTTPLHTKVNVKNYYTFKAPENARYTFTAESDDVVSIINRYNSDFISLYGSGESKYVGLNKDETIYLAVSYEEMQDPEAELAAEANIRVRAIKETPSPISKGSIVYTIKPNEKKWFEFTAAKEGSYSFDFMSRIDDGDYNSQIAYKYYDFLSSNYSNYSSSFSGINLDSEDKCFFAVENTYDVPMEVKINVSSISYDTLSLGQTTVRYDGERLWYKFTAPSDGRYSFTAESDSGASINRYYSAGSAPYSAMYLVLYQGEEIILGVDDYYSGANITIKAYEESPVKYDNTGDYDSELGAHEKEWIEFTAPKSGLYNISFKYKNDSYFYSSYDQLYVYKMYSITDTPYGTNESEFNVVLSAGESVLFEAENYFDTYPRISVVTSIEYVYIDKEIPVGEYKSITLESTSDIYVITGGNGGFYNVILSSDAGVRARINSGDVINDSEGVIIRISDGDYTVINFEGDVGDIAEVMIKEDIQEEDISYDDGRYTKANISIKNGESYDFSFSVDRSGYYSIYSTGSYDTYGTLSGSYMRSYTDDDSADGSNFKITYMLEAGLTYNINVKGYGNRACKCNLVIEAANIGY